MFLRFCEHEMFLRFCDAKVEVGLDLQILSLSPPAAQLVSDDAKQLVACSLQNLIAPEALNGFLLFAGGVGIQAKINLDSSNVDNVDVSIHTTYVQLRRTPGNTIPAGFCLPSLRLLYRREATAHLGVSRYTGK